MGDQQVRQANISDSAEIAAMCALLWPDSTASEHRIEIEELIRTGICGGMPFTTFVSYDNNCKLTGFLQVNLRSHADGCNPARPVGYVEGWFVMEKHRRQGVGAAMMRAAEDWPATLAVKRWRPTPGSTSVTR